MWHELTGPQNNNGFQTSFPSGGSCALGNRGHKRCKTMTSSGEVISHSWCEVSAGFDNNFLLLFSMKSFSVVQLKSCSHKQSPEPHSTSITEDHSHSNGRVCVLSIHHWQGERPLHFLPQHLVSGDGAPTAHDSSDPGLLQKISRHHGGHVVKDSAAQCPGHMTKREVCRGDVGHLTQAHGVVSLPEDGWPHSEVTGFLIQGAANQLLVEAQITLLLHTCG